MGFLENDDNQRKTNLLNVITQVDPLSLVDLDELITKLFIANYVSVHDSITLTKMTNLHWSILSQKRH